MPPKAEDAYGSEFVPVQLKGDLSQEAAAGMAHLRTAEGTRPRCSPRAWLWLPSRVGSRTASLSATLTTRRPSARTPTPRNLSVLGTPTPPGNRRSHRCSPSA